MKRAECNQGMYWMVQKVDQGSMVLEGVSGRGGCIDVPPVPTNVPSRRPSGFAGQALAFRRCYPADEFIRSKAMRAELNDII